MGRRGPQPIPTAVKLRNGVTAPSRLNLTEPVPRQRPPRIPAGLSAEEQTVWRSALREAAPGQIVAADGYLLEMFATAVVERRRALQTYARSGVPGLIARRGARGGHGDEVVRHPIVLILKFWSDEVLRLARELGLSPAGRASLHVLGEDGVADGIEATIGPAPRLRIMASHLAVLAEITPSSRRLPAGTTEKGDAP